MSAEQLITEHIDLWTSTIKARNTQGRGSSKKREFYGIKKLRELILELAVRGKLVAQDPNDEPTRVLLERIAAEKEQLVKVKKIKTQKPLPEITDEEKSFDLPESWSWQRFSSVFYPISVGQNKVKTSEIQEEGKFPVVDQGQSFIAGYIDKEELEIKLPGPVIIFGDHTTSLKYVSFNFIAGADGVKILRPISGDERYFYLVSQSLPIENRGYGRHYSRFVDNLFPLPPLEEQHRIVAKVNELMSLCDQLERQAESSLDAHNLLVDTLLATLTNARDSNELSNNWARFMATDDLATENAGAISGSQSVFDTLITTDYAVEQLKQTILQLAIQGKLVPQDPNDEPASELLKRITTEKEQLIKDRKIKKQKPLERISDEAKLFELPSGWNWSRFGAIFKDLKYGTSQKSDYHFEGAPVLRIPNVVKGYLESSDLKFSVLSDKEIKDYSLEMGDILQIRSNGSASIVGSTAVVDKIHVGFSYAGYLVRIRLIKGSFSPAFLHFVLKSRFCRTQIEGPLRTTSGVKNINSTEIGNLILPCAPLNEQHRVVAKVDELMTLCDRLKSHLHEAQTIQLHLTDAVVDNALAV